MVKITTPEIQDFEIKHLAFLRKIAPECMVLLKKNGAFPLAIPCKLALYGSGARETIKGGTGSGDVNVRHTVTVEEGLEKAGFTITTKMWLDAYRAARDEATKKFYDGIADEAKEQGKPVFLVGMGKIPPEPQYNIPLNGEGNVCLYVLSRNSGEGTDRPGNKGDLLLTDDEIRDILFCANNYEAFMLVLNVGGPVDLSPVADKVENILLLSQLGSVTGDALADVVLGKAYPSGKLTTTWAKAEKHPKIGDFAERDDTRYREGIFVGYRYYDATRTETLFPFGYGLGYTDFDINLDSFTVENNEITVCVTVKNTGAFVGKETVQLYYSSPPSELVKPIKELGAYEKTRELLPGEEDILTLKLPIENMASWDENSDSWILDKGDYIISVNGTSVGVVELDGKVIVESLSHSGGETDFDDWEPQLIRKVPNALRRILIKSKNINLLGHYSRYYIKKDHIGLTDLSDFTDRELATICVGKHSDAVGMAAIIGNSASRLAGGAGETASVVYDKGCGAIVMADGPAGLRIATKYIETEAGQDGLDTEGFEGILNIIPEDIRKLILLKLQKNKEKAKENTVMYHYASAIPIGTALAQSWNLDVIEECGSIVGEEMEMFGANLWLAPALNIHRSPLCGRNFEYYSEDPVVSGKTAAAITRGVQKHEKCAVTIKHFLCNNQETNRFGSNSIVSQRALREIYLKGFEICVKESAPKALMTSYNLLNGIHTANRYDMNTTVLREEFGFEGIVMTDWGTTGDKFNIGTHGASSAPLCIKSGNDLIMPGETADVDAILEGIAKGTVTRKELEKCAGRILALSKELS